MSTVRHALLGAGGAGLLAVALAPACGGSVNATGSTTSSSGSTSSSHAASSSASSSSGAGGGGGSGGMGGGGGACVDGSMHTTTFVPGPADIAFKAVNPVPQGEQILFNDWNPSPNTLSSMTVDGATTTPIFEAFRVWSLGVSRAGDQIAFACGDPMQQAHYGLSIGDAIQHTWLYAMAAGTISLITDGNVNDECHVFGPGDASIFICRRYDFDDCGGNKGYRIGRIDLPSNAFTFLSPDDPSTMALSPQPTPDGTKLLFHVQKVVVSGLEDDILQEPLPMGASTTLRPFAGQPVISPDGTRYVYSDYTDAGRLHVSNLDGTQPVLVAETPGDSPAWSPDGTKIVYLFDDAAANCAHVEIVSADGSTASTPSRIRDCSTTHEYITELAWFKRP